MLNIAGFFDPLLSWIQHAVTEGFIRSKHVELLNIAAHPEELLNVLARHEPTLQLPKWIGPENR